MLLNLDALERILLLLLDKLVIVKVKEKNQSNFKIINRQIDKQILITKIRNSVKLLIKKNNNRILYFNKNNHYHPLNRINNKKLTKY